jgi:hypothetical protein
MAKLWKRGRGNLGFLQPLLGRWVADAITPIGPVHCSRTFAKTLHDTYILLDARWEFPPTAAKPSSGSPSPSQGPRVYEELALIGVSRDGTVGFWSFTSDGKNSTGTVADVTDIHEEALGFEAQMPAGLARMVYWPDPDGSFHWAVESKSAKGWKRFAEHHYHPA